MRNVKGSKRTDMLCFDSEKIGKDVLKTYAGRKMESVYLVYAVILEEEPKRIKLSAITNEMLEYWNIKEERAASNKSFKHAKTFTL